MKKLNLITDILIPIIAIVAVVVCFLLFIPVQPGSVYWFNFIWSVLATSTISLFFVRMHLNGNKVSTPIIIAIASYAILYALVMIFVMFAYFCLVEPGVIWILADFPSPVARIISKLAPLFLSNPELGRGIYFAVFTLLTAAFGISLMLILRHDASFRVYEAEIDRHTNEQRDYTAIMQTVTSNMASALRRKGIVFSDAAIGQTPFDRLATAFRSLTPNIMEKEASRTELDQILTRAKSMVESVNSSTDEDVAQVKDNIDQFTEEALTQIKNIKLNSRK